MPNWCFVTLEIEAKSKKDLDEILDAIKGDGKQHIDFNKIVPQNVNDPEYQCDPEVSHIQPNENPNFNWYDWNRENWGTKWNACDVQEPERFGDTNAKIIFNTAWTFPEPVMEALAKKFPKAKFSAGYWHEDDMDENGEPTQTFNWEPAN